MRNLTDPQGNYGSSYQSLRTEEPPQNPFVSDNESSDAYSLQSENPMYINNNNSSGHLHQQQPQPGQQMPPQQSPFDDPNRPPSAMSHQYYNEDATHQYPYHDQYNQYPYSPDMNQPMMREVQPQQSLQPQVPQQPQHLTPGSRQSSTSLSGLAEYDRYPNRISSAAPSITSGAPLLHPSAAGAAGAAAGVAGARGSTMSDETASSFSSEKDTNPFVVNADFSPFGGYPASSFPLHLDEKEADDYLHNPDPILDAKYDRRCQGLDRRGWAALFAFGCLFLGGVALFIVLPVLTYSGVADYHPPSQKVEILTNYEYGILGGIRTNLVDDDTPEDAKTHKALDGSEWKLVFSDEFNKEGRTFYEGDDQFWTGPDFHYASTQDLEWYSPDAITTENGTLVLQMDAFKNHDLFYRSGMLQSWNKLCFTQGYIEVSASIAGHGDVQGLWPGIWTLGNLARPGFKATSDGLWPYSYDACDAGITVNQSSPDGISYLPGQRLNKCTCPGHDHPNEGVGRGAPEIDALEGTVSEGIGGKLNGVASQSLQTAPFDIWYIPDYNFIEVHNKEVSAMNTYTGGPLQQAVSATTTLNHLWYEFPPSDATAAEIANWTPGYQKYGFEYMHDNTDGYIRWFVGDDPTVTMYAPALGPNGNVDQRLIAKEPMSIILNLGISNSWTYINWPALEWPSKMRIDYVRIYQSSDSSSSVTCDPDDYPTYQYIKDHENIYQNPNLTLFSEGGYAFPPTKLLGQC